MQTAPTFDRPQAAAVSPTRALALPRFAGLALSFGRGAEIYGEGEPAEQLYQVISGTVRTCRLLGDGRRQIESFHLAGDVFGLETGPVRRLSAEAVSAVSVAAVRRSAARAAAARDPDYAEYLLTRVERELERAQDHLVLLGCRSAPERVAEFLIDLAERLGTRAGVELPMPRQDIADYLGLTIETVSRIFTQLEANGAIRLDTARRVVFRDRAALVRLGRS